MAADIIPLDANPELAQQVSEQYKTDGQPVKPEEQDKMFVWSTAEIHLKRLINNWNEELRDTEQRRKLRKVEINVEELRQKGILDEDETIIPVRTIDTNIQREQPPYINYLKNSRRLAIFRSLSKPKEDTELLELEFTRGMSYTSWETPHFKCLDGSQTHGWASVEITYDKSKPLNCGLEYIAHDKLIFPTKTIDLQQCPRIIRIYDVSMLQLRDWVDKYGFSDEQVSIILDKRKNTEKENDTIRIYKCYFKTIKQETQKMCVYVAWFAVTEGMSDWLKQPMEHSVGIKSQQQVPDFQINQQTGQTEQTMKMQWVDEELSDYPIMLLPYRETEEDEITAHKGRCFYDENKQESQTATLSGFVNGITRASNIYASPKQEDGSGVSLAEIKDVKLSGGRLLNKPIEFWHTDYPDPMVLKALQWFDTSNSAETNQVNYAAMNREDSRKTATEIEAAQGQQQLLNSVQLTLFSTFIRQVYSFAWLIVQSQALQGEIVFLIVEKQRPKVNPFMGQQPVIDPQTQQPEMETYEENDFERIAQIYDVRAAGDVDVVEKQELITSMQQDFALVSGTALKDQFIADYLRLKYPEQGEKYVTILQQNSQMQTMQSLIARLGTVLNGALTPEMLNNRPQQEQADLSSLMQEAQTYMQPQGQQPQQQK